MPKTRREKKDALYPQRNFKHNPELCWLFPFLLIWFPPFPSHNAPLIRPTNPSSNQIIYLRRFSRSSSISMKPSSSSSRMISWTTSTRSLRGGIVISEWWGRNISWFQSKPWPALTQVTSRAVPSRVPRSKTVCSCFDREELRSDWRRRWPKMAADGELDEEDISSDEPGEGGEEAFLEAFLGIGMADDILVKRWWY